MKNKEKQKANRRKYKTLERETARIAGLDNIIGDRGKYRDPTADAAIASVYREQMAQRARTDGRHRDSVSGLGTNVPPCRGEGRKGF